MPPTESELQRAIRYHRSGHLHKAEEVYARILDSNPDQADALHLSGVLAHQSGRDGAAVNLINRAIEIDPDEPSFYCNLGNALMNQERFDEAIISYQKALQIQPDMAKAHYNMGNALYALARSDQAIACYQEALMLDPDIAETHNNLGNAFREQGRLDEAIECYEKALRIRPGLADAHNNLGRALKGIGKFSQAAVHYRSAIRLSPDSAEALYNYGNLLHEQGRLDKAIAYYQEALENRPGYVDAYDNMAKTLSDLGRFDEAISCYERSLLLDPHNPEAIFDRSVVHLLTGNFAEGWRGYEWRFKRSRRKRVYPHTFDIPRWQGSPFEGKTLFVHSEQGLGDCLQFVRYLPMVKAMGGKVILETLKPLVGLFRDLEGIDELVEGPSHTTKAYGCDFYVPLLSLPGVFNTRLHTIPSRVPYLFADPRKVRQWRDRLRRPGLKVGLVWAGKASDRRRSCPLDRFTSFSRIPGVQFIGLQKGEAAGEAYNPPEGMDLVNLGEELEDFTDTAALIENLDLVISIDTSVAHLAGSMGKPVWVLLISSPDWRWLIGREDSPWYPSMRLFRQRRPGEWGPMLDKVTDELRMPANSVGRVGNPAGRRRCAS